MPTKFLEPGGDANFLVASGVAAPPASFWSGLNGTPAVATDFVHGNHQNSIKFRPSNTDRVERTGILADAGTRISFYIYFVALPGAEAVILDCEDSGFNRYTTIRIGTGGQLRLFYETTQIGSDGPSLATGVWYRISLAYKITSTTVNRFEVFLNAVSAISVTNSTFTITGATDLMLGNRAGDAAMDIRMSDFYVDDSSALTDTGNVWVTVKRPNANGTINGFTTQVGAGGSGYGSGHSPQVNERPQSATNGWSMVGAGAAVTEEYTVEGASVGDIDISGKTIIDWQAWILANALVGEQASIVAGGVSSTFTLPVATRLVTKIVGSTTYPAGGTDVGIITSTTVTTVNLYECGVIIAYIGGTSTPTPKPKPTLLFLGVG